MTAFKIKQLDQLNKVFGRPTIRLAVEAVGIENAAELILNNVSLGAKMQAHFRFNPENS